MRGKTVVITGGTSGIGEVAAETLAKMGAQFALNHMAYFVVTAGLREHLSASRPARIINTASDGHIGSR
jgi:NAD(P)-dependent dehydrogenase (short-subunit alcohol dehydrogenase family)